MRAPRLLLSAPASGCGKTTVTCALLQALADRGADPVSFKSGPDYIDPMFHTAVMGVPARNLDLFLMGEGAVRRALAAGCAGHGVAVLEGAMGYYDGVALSSRASAWDLARRTGTPAVLVVDGRGAARSLAAVVKGFQTLERASMLRGVIFNRVSPMLYPRLKDCVEAETGLKVCGFLPNLPGCTLESRHLGLVTAAEVANLRETLATLARAAAEYLDLEGLLALAEGAEDLPEPEERRALDLPVRPRIGVARDRAFCFYYADALALLEELGAELVEFSPLSAERLPPGCAGLYLGGGYPELYARELARNGAMCRAVREAVLGGMPTVAECGGFLYLHRTLADREGEEHPQADVIPARAWNGGKLRRFGYVTLTAQKEGLLCGAGESLPAHEFHYWESGAPGGDFYAQKPQSSRSWTCAWHTDTLYAGFPHVHFCGCPDAAARFVSACARYAGEKRSEYHGMFA